VRLRCSENILDAIPELNLRPDTSRAEREPRFRVNTFQGTKREKRVPENAARRRRTGRSEPGSKGPSRTDVMR